MVAHEVVLWQDRIDEFCVEHAGISGEFPVVPKWQTSNQIVFLCVTQQNVRQSRAPCFMRLKHLVRHIQASCFCTLVKTRFLRGTPSQLGNTGL